MTGLGCGDQGEHASEFAVGGGDTGRAPHPGRVALGGTQRIDSSGCGGRWSRRWGAAHGHQVIDVLVANASQQGNECV